MSFGSRVWDENANLVMDTTTFTYQVIWQGVIDFSDTSGSTAKVITLSIPGFDPANCVFMVIPTRAQDIQSAEGDATGNTKSYPYVTTSAGQVVLRSANPSANLGNTNQTRIVAKGFAVRFKI
ncbi:hypothetical protein ALP12_200263 [Pseudomonas savastanoi pv. phaseolicola]|uniref:hypothetical protein n=1 Tax=Pseudomonas savastanoi TaxID=29438 RepID=UPI0006B960D2|nr:hypothetical protein [Pseudomonas savastanoi]KPB43503.1 Uncharacterized protein AC515_1016 [Pseudomonas savastanoi pv. phaseolicola]RMV27341.1 hypothetical protein ALP12_200263 [Pseudomonas savastanoi pv. phaseolicola]